MLGKILYCISLDLSIPTRVPCDLKWENFIIYAARTVLVGQYLMKMQSDQQFDDRKYYRMGLTELPLRNLLKIPSILSFCIPVPSSVHFHFPFCELFIFHIILYLSRPYFGVSRSKLMMGDTLYYVFRSKFINVRYHTRHYEESFNVFKLVN
jgi:hypothetical protein